ncbi:hypothetical protein GALMADRAFT_225220 [Galerina marginata CBS 339.88]|uniref:F-box domain-containing protein n=1 Tax=Galerina marginata (strain CBS 339.88) TaxID=685588 RepID=A0A067TB25_GALM3|nr:hypothetical protein GALMADRAFT_225220 [Galerina marginata CBS 339.88]
MTLTRPKFPQELFDAFVDDIGREYRNLSSPLRTSCRLALQACLFVSRSFCHRARRYLFATVGLTQGVGREKSIPLGVHKLMQILHSDLPVGGIARYIKQVMIGIIYHVPPAGPMDQGVDSSLVAFLRAMIGDGYGICDFLFVISIPGKGCLGWDRISPDLRECFADTACSPHLTRVYFLGLSHIPRAVFLNPHLKHLHLKSSIWRSEEFIQAQQVDAPLQTTSIPQLLARTRLESLTTDHTYPIKYFEHSSAESPLSSLSTLRSHITASPDFFDCMGILSRAARTITLLNIIFVLRAPVPPKALNLRSFPRLRWLEVEAELGAFEMGIQNIFRLLDSPSASKNLFSIDFTVKSSKATSYPRGGLLSPAGSPSPYWRRLDALLSGSKYSSVKTVSFFFSIDFTTKPANPPEEFYITETVARLKRTFPRILRSKSLEINVEVK